MSTSSHSFSATSALFVVLVLLVVPSATAQPVTPYPYVYTDQFSTINTTSWYANNAANLSAGATGLTSSSQTGGSLIYTNAPGNITQHHEVKAKLRLTQSGGYYVVYFRASANAQFAPGAMTGTYYAAEVTGVTVNDSGYTATVSVYKVVNGSATLLSSFLQRFWNGSLELRAISTPDIITLITEGERRFWAPETSISQGSGGIGIRAAPAGNSISLAQVGVRESVPPNPLNPANIATYVTPHRADMEWQPPSDHNGGTGVSEYQVCRQGGACLGTYSAQFTDPTVAPGTTYVYTVTATDFHANISLPHQITITTPPAGQIDPRRVGVRPNAAYWGASPEQIDMLSGNLNVSIPLVTAMRRGGASISFALSYNSQLWRKETRSWKLGDDIGFGFGWRLMAGSITPYHSAPWEIDHYLFIDASGAEYRLYPDDTPGRWIARGNEAQYRNGEPLYITYSSDERRL
jgi:hypothetical protein